MTGELTHTCFLFVLIHPLSQVQKGSLSCTQLAAVPGCDLTVYYNSSGGFNPLLSGVKTARLPGPNNTTAAAQSGSPVVTAKWLGLVTPRAGDVLQPLLYLHGSTKCNILLPSPIITGIKLPLYYSQNQKYNTTTLVSGQRGCIYRRD